MKIRNILLMALAAVLSAACMNDDWETPDTSKTAQGNTALQETNVISIAALKQKYAVSKEYDTIQIKEPTQIKVYVTGNDIQGNLYSEFSVQDENGDALIICVQEGNMFAYLPVGQWLLVELQGLYFGQYGSQPQIGVPYTNPKRPERTSPSRMPGATWKAHYRLLEGKKAIQSKAENAANPIEGAYVIPEYTAAQFKRLGKEHAGKLMTITGVTMDNASSHPQWANEADAPVNTNTGKRLTAVSKYFVGEGTNLMTYTSTYADFAGFSIPEGKLNLTGIWKYYQSNTKYAASWELVLRSIEDVKVAE